MNPLWLVRMKRWVQNPPSPARIKLIVAIIGLCLVVFALERMFGWPDALTPNDLRRLR
jgi:hypothetical protein